MPKRILTIICMQVFQILEGPPHQVEETFEKIKADPRHQNIVIRKHSSESRRFEDFPMYWSGAEAEKDESGDREQPEVEVLHRVQYQSTMVTADVDAALKEVEDIVAAAKVGYCCDLIPAAKHNLHHDCDDR